MRIAQAATLRGMLGAGLLVLAGSLALLPLVAATDLDPSASLLRGLAQIGATLLVAYAVEVSWLPRVSAVRGEDRASWVGYAAGVGISALIGAALALGLSEADTGSLSLVGQLGLAWALFSLALLGLLVALLPLLIHEWGQTVTDEEPADLHEDETREFAE